MQSKHPFKKILVPMNRTIDLTQRLSMFIAEKFSSDVTILHVVSSGLMYPGIKETFADIESTQLNTQLARIHEQAYKEGERNLSNAAAQFKQKGFTVQERIVENVDPAEAIIEEAEKAEHGLVIIAQNEAKEMGTYLGSVSEKVSQYSRTPVLIAREIDSISRILVPIDGSEHALNALEYATAIAREAKAEITLLNVQEQSSFRSRTREEKRTGDLILSKSAKKVEGITLHQRLESGDPGKIITQLADEDNFDLIILGSKGQSSRLRFLMGSVSSHVIHYANRSVLVVPKRDTVEALSPEDTIDRLIDLHIATISSLGSYAREKSDEQGLQELFEYQSKIFGKGLENVEWRADEIAKNMIRLNFQPFGMEAKYSGNNEKATINVTKCPLPEKFLQSLEFLRVIRIKEKDKFNWTQMFVSPDRVSATWEWPPKKIEICKTCRIIMPKLGEKLGFIWEHQITDDIPPQCIFNIEIKNH